MARYAIRPTAQAIHRNAPAHIGDHTTTTTTVTEVSVSGSLPSRTQDEMPEIWEVLQDADIPSTYAGWDRERVVCTFGMIGVDDTGWRYRIRLVSPNYGRIGDLPKNPNYWNHVTASGQRIYR